MKDCECFLEMFIINFESVKILLQYQPFNSLRSSSLKSNERKTERGARGGQTKEKGVLQCVALYSCFYFVFVLLNLEVAKY